MTQILTRSLAIIALSGVAAAQAPATIDWFPRAVSASPQVGQFSAMAFDSGQAGVLHFATNLSNGTPQTSLFDGVIWSNLAPTASPSARTGHAMATYAPASAPPVLLFGGTSPTTPLSDTWQWNGTNWASVTPATSPPARHRHAMAGSGANVLMFGGISVPGSALGDTWLWNGTNWNQLIGPVGLTARTDHAMVTLANNDVLLFGGRNGGFLGDTWLWQAATQAWTQLPITGPSPRQAHSMAYDSMRRVVVLFGGIDATGTLGDSWEFRPEDLTWTQVSPSTAPPAAAFQACDYDPVRNSVVSLDGNQGTTWMFTYAATYSVFGQGCTGYIGVPSLAPATGSVPTIGGSLQLSFAQLFPQNPPAFIYLIAGTAANPQGIVIHPLQPNCLLYVAGTTSTTSVAYDPGTGTTASITIPIPNNLGLIGMFIAHQALVPDPSRPAGFALTNAASGYLGL